MARCESLDISLRRRMERDHPRAPQRCHRSPVLVAPSAPIRIKKRLILGTEDHIRRHASWWKPENPTLYMDADEEVLSASLPHNGYAYKAAEIARCLQAERSRACLCP